MSEAQSFLHLAQQAEESGRLHEARGAAARAVEASKGKREKFEALLWRARAESLSGDPDSALQTYWDARNYTRTQRLGKTGEADLGIGVVMLDVGRHGEGLETIRRAERHFRKTGNTLMRGCAELILAEETLALGDVAGAERHAHVATDLLLASGDPRMLSSAASLLAEILAWQGRDKEADALLVRAQSIARDVAEQRAACELRDRRHAVAEMLRRRDAAAPAQAATA